MSTFSADMGIPRVFKSRAGISPARHLERFWVVIDLIPFPHPITARITIVNELLIAPRCHASRVLLCTLPASMPKPRSSCWTCSLRHKKCDNEAPTCLACRSLEIQCHNGSEKPSWMDKGKREESMRREIQEVVKLKARRRRQKVLLQRAIRDLDENDLDVTSIQADPSDGNNNPRTRAEEEDLVSGQSDDLDPGSPPNRPDTEAQQSPVDPFQAVAKELEFGNIMVYLDHTLPAIFPFYKPSLRRAGRGWLLTHIMDNEALRHIIVSISAHFLTVVSIVESSGRKICEMWVLQEFGRRVTQAIVRVRRDIGNPGNWHDTGGGLLGKVHLLESVVHLMLLEVSRAETEQWALHLNAAVMLLRQIMSLQNENDENPFQSVFLQLGHAIDGNILSYNLSPWGADQASFYFSASVLAAADIISSISLRKRPKLQELHPVLLSEQDASGEVTLQLQDCFGCSSRVFLILSDIAGLDAWKNESKQSGTFSITELVRRGWVIEGKITEAMAHYTLAPDNPSGETLHNQSRRNQYLETATGIEQAASFKTNHVWLLSARVYLHVVLSGWQRLAPVIVEVVDEAISVLWTIPPKQLSAVAWPFCVIGCIAPPSHGHIFREMHESVGPAAKFGSMAIAMNVLMDVWRGRDDMGIEPLDVAACFENSGYRVLLL